MPALRTARRALPPVHPCSRLQRINEAPTSLGVSATARRRTTVVAHRTHSMPATFRLAFLPFCALLAALPSAVTSQSYQPVLSPAPGDSGATVEITRHPNGQLAKRVFLKNGKPHGLWQEWDAEGRATYAADWRDGGGEGLWLYFHPNGIVRERGYVTGDVWHGPSEGWHSNGQKSNDGTFVRGAKAGPFRYWSEDGTPRGPWVELLTPARTPVAVLSEGWPFAFNTWDITLAHDLELLFVGTGDDEGKQSRIMMRRWQQNVWQPVTLAPFADTTAAEGTPVTSPDGEWVYFSSTRHVATDPTNTKRELYRASRASGWKTVERITHTPMYGEVSLTLARDGRGVMWSGQPDGATRTGLYEVRLETSTAPGTSTPTPRVVIIADLTSLHTGDSSGEAYPVLSPDGSFLLFSNYDIGGAGTKEDVFISRRTTTGWSAPQRLTRNVNSSGDEKAVQLLDEGRVLLFSAPRAEGAPVYRVSLDAVLPPKR